MAKKWTKSEIEYLKENYKTKFYSKIAEELCRTHSAIWCKVNKLGFKSGNRTKPRNQAKENNPNWKGGRSKNNYYYRKRQKLKFPEKDKAREKVHRALISGKLIKPNECEKCGKFTLNLEGHHEDYNQPLKVVWCCKKCHCELHR